MFSFLVAPDSLQATSVGDTAVLRVIEAYCLGSRMKQAASEFVIIKHMCLTSRQGLCLINGQHTDNFCNFQNRTFFVTFL